ncbi:cysteine--tRNA ligase [Candidatus Pacearchaeota archaeon]|nr:cysteine--tRNA ligase [Candidatus Pacearchaeota archaeon]
MVLKLYNTLTRKKGIFKPVKKNQVKIYVCGPTVNDVPHLGHARMQIIFDVLRRYLKFLKYDVKFVSNITDIEDKIINKAKELNEDINKLTERNLKSHLEDYEKIGISKPDFQPKATEYVNDMIALIKKLESKGYTYIIKNDGVYYNISKFKGYGKLSHQDIKKLKSGLRVKEKEGKKNKEDFVLWKFSKPGEPKWESPWGEGRPGWHIECSAMSEKILGLPLDIHGGGQDLIFPHHEDEIAQSEVGYGKKFANYWIHNGMVNVDKIKMSKSLGNFKTIRDILKDYSGETIRYFVISTQYRKPIDFSKKALDNSENSYQRLKNIISEIRDDKKLNKKYLAEFENAMNDDLNTAKALQVLWNLVRDKKAEGKIATTKKIDEVFGLNLLKKEKIEIPNEIMKLVDEREIARKNSDWKKSDELRKKINNLGYFIEDTKRGYVLKKK